MKRETIKKRIHGYIKSSTVPSNGAVTIPFDGSTYVLAKAFAVYGNTN